MNQMFAPVAQQFRELAKSCQPNDEGRVANVLPGPIQEPGSCRSAFHPLPVIPAIVTASRNRTGSFHNKVANSGNSASDPIPDIPLSDYRREMHVIGKHNSVEAGDAIRDILMMYVDLAEGTAGFGHNADVYVRFDPLKFVDAEVEEDSYYHVDLELLRTGSAVAILCAFYNVWTEEQKLEGLPLTERFQAAIGAGRLSRFPDIEGVILEAIRRNCAPIEDQWMDDAVRPIYRKYVIGYFARLAKQDRSEPAT